MAGSRPACGIGIHRPDGQAAGLRGSASSLTGLRHGSKIATGALRNDETAGSATRCCLPLAHGPGSAKLRAETDHVVVPACPEMDVLPAASARAVRPRDPRAGRAAHGDPRAPNVQAALIGCLLMGLGRAADFNSAYGAINWKTLILIVGISCHSLALQRPAASTWRPTPCWRWSVRPPRLVLHPVCDDCGSLACSFRTPRPPSDGASGHCVIAKDLGTCRPIRSR